MTIIKKEKLCLTEEEFQILKKAKELLDEIYTAAEADGEIEWASSSALENICYLFQDEISEII